MATLHTVNRTPAQSQALARCLSIAQDDASLLLIEDGVYAALAGNTVADLLRTHLMRLHVYVLEPDLLARGLGQAMLDKGVQRVDYDGFVELAVSHQRVVTWS